LVEKPLCTDVADAAHIRDAAATDPGVLWVGLEYRYMPPVAKAIEVAHSGQLGEIAMISIREHRHPFLVKVGDWNRFNRYTGGTLVEKCCHFFDLMRLIAGANPRSVTAMGGQRFNHLGERYDGEQPDILDHAYVIVEFENDVRASLDLSMFAEASGPSRRVSRDRRKGQG
jgi:predicted dehydrogenase